jgi:hypothetical protein
MLNGIFIGALTFSISFLPFFFKNIINLSEDYIGLAIGFAIWLVRSETKCIKVGS